MATPIGADPVLNVAGATVRVDGAVILDDVSLSARAGELVALVGPNGAGKSTLLGVAAGDLEPTAGTVDLFGRPLPSYATRTAARHRSVLLQEQRIAFSFRVRRVVEMGRTAWYRTEAEARDDVAVEEAIERVDIAHLADRQYPSLSGGEKARASLARTLAQEAGLVLLDEPTAALDMAHQERVLKLVRQLADEGHAVVIVLHDLSLAATADRVCLLKSGRVVADGRPEDVITAELIGTVYDHPVDVIRHGESLVVVPQRAGSAAEVTTWAG